MKNTVFGYSNNGLYPFRYVRKSSRKAIILHEQPKNENYEKLELSESEIISRKNLNRGFSTSGVSQVTRRKILRSCRVLAIASTSRTVRTSSGQLKSHLNTFITLTLPAEQQESDQFVTKNILGHFLDRCRKLSLLSNYVWRAEKQKNGNIHYHILTDSYAYYNSFRRIWYLSLRKFGYMSRYQDKFSKMSFLEYKSQKFNDNSDINTISARYARGQRNNWSEPPCVDVEFIDTPEAVSKYIAKYVGKDSAGSDNIVSGRCWGCSQSVSESVKNFTGDAELNKYWFSAGAEIIKRKVREIDFFSICIFKFSSLIAWFPDTKKYIKKLLSRSFTPCDYWRNSVGLFT